MDPTPQFQIIQKYMIEVTYYKKMLKFNLPDTGIESLITFLRKANKVNETESVYLYLQPSNKLINRMSKISQLVKESENANARVLVARKNKPESGQTTDVSDGIGNKNVLRIRMQAYETF